MATSPIVVVIAGPNGAGKSSAAPMLLRALGIETYVNADVLAVGLSRLNPDAAAIEAGRVMLDRLEELSAMRASFAFETTLSGRVAHKLLTGLGERGYEIYIAYLWIPNAEFSMTRVQERVAKGGHGVPQSVLVRRYMKSLRNFYHFYRPLAKQWWVYDSSHPDKLPVIASGCGSAPVVVERENIWLKIQDVVGNSPASE